MIQCKKGVAFRDTLWEMHHYFGGGFLHLCFNEVRQRSIWNSVLPPSLKSCALEVRGIVSFL